MAVKVQYNQIIGKVSYNPATGLVQVVDTGPEPGFSCTKCDPDITPKFVKVTFAGITTVTNTCFNCGIARDQSWSGVFDPNNEYILEQTGSGVITACNWELTFAVDITVTQWNSTDGSCTGGVHDSHNITEMSVIAFRDLTDVDVQFQDTSSALNFFRNPAILTSVDCVDSAGNGAGDTGLGCTGSTIVNSVMAYGGTATVEAI